MYGPHYVLVAATVALQFGGRRLVRQSCRLNAPVYLRRLKFDPAAASAPFVATLVDVTGLVIYFSIAYRIPTERCCGVMASRVWLRRSTKLGFTVLERGKSWLHFVAGAWSECFD